MTRYLESNRWRAIGALSTTILLLCFTACTTVPLRHGPVKLDVPFWQQQPRKLDIVLFDAPPGDLYRNGGDELLHALITDERDKELVKLVGSSAPDFEWVVDRFAAHFAERDFPVERLDAEDVQVSYTKDVDSIGDLFRPDLFDVPPYSLKPEAAANRDAQLLLVIRPGSWGIARDYEFGAVPIGAHYAAFSVVAELWDLPNRLKLWSGSASGSAALPRQWNEPPDHPKVRAALEQALQACGDGAVGNLERWEGAKAEMVYPLPKAGGK